MSGAPADHDEVAMTTIEGRLEFYSETGTEGGWWAFFDPRFEHGPELVCSSPHCPLKMREVLDEDGNGTNRYTRDGAGKQLFDRHQSRDGLIVLQDGDELEIRHPQASAGVLFKGPLKFLQQNPYGEDSRDLRGLAIHTFPVLIFSDYPWITLEEWGDWFLQCYPATLITEQETHDPRELQW